MINEKLIPQYKNGCILKTEYLPASRANSGIGSLPLDKIVHATYVKQWTTTAMTPDEIHQLGLNEVAFNCRNGEK
jgi:uncharacterized protein (DUF885 family)